MKFLLFFLFVFLSLSFANNIETEQDLLNEKVTLIIKTHERPKSLKQLITSIREFYPKIKV